MERYRNGPEDPRALNHAISDGTAPAAPDGAVPPTGFSPSRAPDLRPQPKLQPLPNSGRLAPEPPAVAPYASWTQNIWQTGPQASGAAPLRKEQTPPPTEATGEAGVPVFTWTQNFWPTAQADRSGGPSACCVPPPQPAPIFSWTQNYWPQPYQQTSVLWPNAGGQLTVYPPVSHAPIAGSFAPVTAPGQPVAGSDGCAWQPVMGQAIPCQYGYACPAATQDTSRAYPPARHQSERPPVSGQPLRDPRRQQETVRYQPVPRQPVPACDSWRTIPERTMAYRPTRRGAGGIRPEPKDVHSGDGTMRGWQTVRGQADTRPMDAAGSALRACTAVLQNPAQPSDFAQTKEGTTDSRVFSIIPNPPADRTAMADTKQQDGVPAFVSNAVFARVPDIGPLREASPINPASGEGDTALGRRYADTTVTQSKTVTPLPAAAAEPVLIGETANREGSEPRVDGATSSRWAIRMAPFVQEETAAPDFVVSHENTAAQAKTPSAQAPVMEPAAGTVNGKGRSARYQTPQTTGTAPKEPADEPEDRAYHYLPRPDLPLLREPGVGNHSGIRLGARRLKWIAGAAVLVALTLAGVQSGLLGRVNELITSAPVPLEGSQTVAAWPTDWPAAETVQPLGTAKLLSATVLPEETTAPATLSFTLTTDSAATAVRLVTDTGEMLRATSSSAPQGDGLVWHISAQLESPYCGAVRFFLRDAAGAWAEGAVSCAVQVQ